MHEPQKVSLERIYPLTMNPETQADKDSLDIHLSRYEFASQHLSGPRVLDMACGCGYGSHLMATAHPDKQFIGVDIDPSAVEFANEHYQLDNLTFVQADATAFASEPFDTIVSLETIEHLPDLNALFRNFVALSHQHTTMIASVPSTPTCDGNPHHLHDFTERSFLKRFRAISFAPVSHFRQVQPWVYDDAFSTDEQSKSRSKGIGWRLMRYYVRKPSALISRLHSLLVHGRCNKYITTVFKRA
jgi:2-polyprenyl-3-methyl-5-hydroxy-6-metoxy-1,4-benzoquinol methylase